MIISRTPFRCSFFGGATDYPEYFNRHGGATLSATIDKYCYLSVHRLTPFFKHRFRASYRETEFVMQPAEFKHPLIRECLLLLNIQEGLEISHVADLPGRTGLGSSSSFTVGLLNALHAIRKEHPSKEQLASEAITVERTRVGDTGGWQDQYAAAYGGLMRVDYRADGIHVSHPDIPFDHIQQLQDRLLMFYLGVEAAGERIAADQRKRIEHNTVALTRMKTMVDEAEDLLRNGQDLDFFGDLLNEAWQIKRGLSSGISNIEIDKAYETARSAGARGGKLLGAGGRGFLLTFVPPNAQAAVRNALHPLPEVSFSFSYNGSQIIFVSDES